MKISRKFGIKVKRDGFTLIELIAVIAVISILAALAVNRYAGVMSDGRTAKQNSVIISVEKAKDFYVADESRTIEEIRAFNQKSTAERFSLLKPFIRLNGVEPTEASLLEGTGKTAIDAGKFSASAYTTGSGSLTVTVPTEAGHPATLN